MAMFRNLLVVGLLMLSWPQPGNTFPQGPALGEPEASHRAIPVGGRYSGQSGGSRYAGGGRQSGISDTYFDGGYGFTRKSFFKNSENDRSHFRNGFATRSVFGHRYDRVSKRGFDRPRETAPGRALPPVPKLDLWQPRAAPRLAPLEGVPPASADQRGAGPLLPADEIERLMAGKRVALQLAETAPLDGRFEAGGAVEYQRGDARWRGAWRAEDDRLCLKLREAEDAPRCYGVARSGSALRFFLPSGAPAGRALLADEREETSEAR